MVVSLPRFYFSFQRQNMYVEDRHKMAFSSKENGKAESKDGPNLS